MSHRPEGLNVYNDLKIFSGQESTQRAEEYLADTVIYDREPGEPGYSYTIHPKQRATVVKCRRLIEALLPFKKQM